jgi:type VI secretion system secreted protein Hcp
MAIYMKIKGIDGHVTTKGYEKWIELDSVGFNVNRSLSTTTGNVTDRERTKPTLSEIAIIKDIDKTTPDLFSAACGTRENGKAIDEIDIHVCHTSGDSVKPYIEYTLNNVLLSNYQIQGDNKCEKARPQETISLNYDKIQMKYTSHDEKHGAGSPVRAGYDLSAGTKV